MIKLRINFVFQQFILWTATNTQIPRNVVNLHVDFVHLKALLNNNAEILKNREIHIKTPVKNFVK